MTLLGACFLRAGGPLCAPVRGVILVLAVTICVSLTISPANAATSSVQNDATLVRELANELNMVRLKSGLPGLRYSPALAAAATMRARQLAAQGWADKSLEGRTLTRRIGRFYPQRSGARAMGELVLWSAGYICGQAVVAHGLKAERDKARLLGAGWREAGIAAVRLPNGHRFAVIELGVR